MKHSPLRLPLAATALLCASIAAAQPAPAPAPAPATAPEPSPALPVIDDPMLKPPPPALNTLTTWREALRMVRARSTSLKTSIAEIEVANGLAREALAGSLPRLTGSAGITQDLHPDRKTFWDASLRLSVPLFAPKEWYDSATARREIEIARLNNRDQERLLLGSVAEAIVSVITAERLAEVSRVSLASALSTLDLNRRRERLGAANAIDVLRTEQEVAQARAQVVSTAEGLLRAREALGLALGYSVPYGVTSGINLNSLAADAANTCRREPDVTSRADVLAAKASRDVARRNRDSVDWRFWPTIDVGSELKYADTIPATAGDHLTWTIFGVLTWELYDGGFRYGESTEKRARFDIAEQNLTEVQRKAGVEVAQSERGVRVAEANLRVSQRLRDVASESSRLSRIAFANGSGTSFDLVDTARRLREAELDLAIKEFELVTAKIKALLAVASCRI